ncbi:MAG: sigma-70 family RNA polymerase sigma factor [Phycisphaerales bacterium JB063]
MPELPAQPAGEQFARLLMKHQPRVYAYVRSMVFIATDADDILQDVAMVAWQRFDTYDPERPFDLWLFGIARNRVRTYFRTKKNDRLRFSDATLDLIERDAAGPARQAEQTQSALETCLGKLSQRDSDLVLRRFTQGATNRSVAHDLGWTDSKISRHLNRVYAVLMLCVRRRMAEGDLA